MGAWLHECPLGAAIGLFQWAWLCGPVLGAWLCGSVLRGWIHCPGGVCWLNTSGRVFMGLFWVPGFTGLFLGGRGFIGFLWEWFHGSLLGVWLHWPSQVSVVLWVRSGRGFTVGVSLSSLSGQSCLNVLSVPQSLS